MPRPATCSIIGPLPLPSEGHPVAVSVTLPSGHCPPKDLERAPATEILRWATHHIPRLAVASSFGTESAVLLHLVSQVAPHLPVLFVDTGMHFDVTLAYRRELARRLGLMVIDVHPDPHELQTVEGTPVPLHARDPGRCCELRKLAPMSRALRGLDGWVTGARRCQTPARADLPIVGNDPRFGADFVSVAPLATWTDDDIASHLRRHRLPPHPLAAQGYPSVGCAPCTARVGPGADPRDGRWPGTARTECGLHLPAASAGPLPASRPDTEEPSL